MLCWLQRPKRTIMPHSVANAAHVANAEEMWKHITRVVKQVKEEFVLHFYIRKQSGSQKRYNTK